MSPRLDRQVLLRADAPPLLWCIRDEAVIRRPVGGGGVMAEQLAHVLHMTGAPHVVVQVLPFGRGEHQLMGGSLTHLKLGLGSEVAYPEGSHSGELVEFRRRSRNTPWYTICSRPRRRRPTSPWP
ncbi:DUF5753 domain-containing protein [Streptomyces sp. ECR3]|uniref:DUF5753 domain-containing protein n=1 Tax=Streptomyces sp. ECR3 TaxID=3400630 RepID=UPI003F1CB91A